MSWWLQLGPVRAADFADVLDAAQAEQVSDMAAEEVAAQVAAGKAAAKVLFFSGALGPVGEQATAQYLVRINGHANPDHQVRPGFARDWLTVTVEQAWDVYPIPWPPQGGAQAQVTTNTVTPLPVVTNLTSEPTPELALVGV